MGTWTPTTWSRDTVTPVARCCWACVTRTEVETYAHFQRLAARHRSGGRGPTGRQQLRRSRLRLPGQLAAPLDHLSRGLRLVRRVASGTAHGRRAPDRAAGR